MSAQSDDYSHHSIQLPLHPAAMQPPPSPTLSSALGRSLPPSICCRFLINCADVILFATIWIVVRDATCHDHNRHAYTHSHARSHACTHIHTPTYTHPPCTYRGMQVSVEQQNGRKEAVSLIFGQIGVALA